MRIAIGGVRGIPARYGGFETSAEETARRIQSLGHKVTVYCRSQAEEDDQSEFAGVRLVSLRIRVPHFMETIVHSIVVGLHIAFKGRDVDVVHFYNAASAFGGLIVRAAGKPLVMTLDGVEWKREKWNWMAKQVWKVATWLAVRVSDGIVCDSQTVQKLFEARYETRIRYIPYGAKSFQNVSNAYKTFGLRERQYFIFVGRLVPEKGVHVLLDGYNMLGTDMPLVIVGDNEDDPGYVEFLRGKAGNTVMFLGYRYGEVYESLLAHARTYVTASKLEGTSPSLLAAMGASVCCLVNCIPENQETGSNAIMYFDGSASDLAHKWTLSMQDDVADAYALKGHERVRANYDWDAVTNQYLSVYSEISGIDNARTFASPGGGPASTERAWDLERSERNPEQLSRML